jgi:hypothetical protein
MTDLKWHVTTVRGALDQRDGASLAHALSLPGRGAGAAFVPDANAVAQAVRVARSLKAPFADVTAHHLTCVAEIAAARAANGMIP